VVIQDATTGDCWRWHSVKNTIQQQQQETQKSSGDSTGLLYSSGPWIVVLFARRRTVASLVTVNIATGRKMAP